MIPNLIKSDLIHEYLKLRSDLNLGKAHFPNFTPYLEHEIIRKIILSCEIHEILSELLLQNMGLHFVLSALHSTERGWHQDDYLNPRSVSSNYCAIWIALDKITDNVGPFEFIPGSHRWPCMRRDLVQKHLSDEFSNLYESNTGGRGHWAEFAETFVNDCYVNEIEKRNVFPYQFLANAGDLLVWHSKLVHRGAPPFNPLAERRAMIGHFSGIDKRNDLGNDIRRYGNDGCYFWNFDY